MTDLFVDILIIEVLENIFFQEHLLGYILQRHFFYLIQFSKIIVMFLPSSFRIQ